MTMLRADLSRVVDIGIVVMVSRVWNIVEIFVSPADDPKYEKNCFALAAGLVSQCSSSSSFTLGIRGCSVSVIEEFCYDVPAGRW